MSQSSEKRDWVFQWLNNGPMGHHINADQVTLTYSGSAYNNALHCMSATLNAAKDREVAAAIRDLTSKQSADAVTIAELTKRCDEAERDANEMRQTLKDIAMVPIGRTLDGELLTRVWFPTQRERDAQVENILARAEELRDSAIQSTK